MRKKRYAARNGQLLRSNTSPLPNHGEAEAAKSSDDFIQKLKICLKELRESQRWLLLVKRVSLLDSSINLDTAVNETEELIRFFTSIRTARKNKKPLSIGRCLLNVER